MTASGPNNPPRRHHYLPECFQRLWAGPDGKVERFAIEHGGCIRARRLASGGIGWVRDLYRIPGEENPWDAQKIETEFFGRLDTAATPIMRRMCETGKVPRTSEERSTWTQFLLSFLHRTPEHLDATLSKLKELNAELMPEAERRYAELKGKSDPATFAEWQGNRQSNAISRSMLSSVMDLISSPKAGLYLVNLEWVVIDFSAADYRLVVGDNPVILVPLKQPNGHLAFPIGPNHLFLASEHEGFMRAIAATSSRRIVRLVNRLMVERASKLVIASDRSQESFIAKHFGTCRIGSLATGLIQPDRPR